MGIVLDASEISLIAENINDFSSDLDSDLDAIKSAIMVFVTHKASVNQAKINSFISEVYNKAIADILLQAGKSATAINKSASQVTLGQQKYNHERQESAQEFVIGTNAENIRHKYQMNYAQIKGYVDAHFTEVDQQTSLLEQSNRPEIKQAASDETYQAKTINEALGKGKNARYDLIPQKDYLSGIRGRMAEIRSALGF